MCGLKVMLFLAFACSATATEIEVDQPATHAVPWTELTANDAERDFHFVVVGDRTGGARPGVFASAIPKVDLLEPAFVLSVGDLIEGYTTDQAQLDREWDEFEGFISGLAPPFFYVAGNHDMSNAVMAETWAARFGPSYYRFVYKDVLFLVLNSELFGMVTKPTTPVPGPWSQAEQLAFIESTLAEVPNPRWTFVITHQPLWDYADGRRNDWPKVEAMLGKRDYTVFAGHFHRYVKHVRQDRKYITLATTGGGSGLRGGVFGEFDHVLWVTMTETGPRLANLMLDGIQDENVVTAGSRVAVRVLASAVRSVPEFVAAPVGAAGPELARGAPTSVMFAVANTGERDLQVSYNVDPGPDFALRGEPEPITVPRGGVERVRIELAAKTPVGLHAITPGRVAWRLITNSPDGPVSVDAVSGLLPVGLLPLDAGPVPTIDGDLGEWPAEFKYQALRQGDVASAPTTTTDVSFAFDLREAGGDLYFAARVTDDSIVASPELGPRVQDALVVTVDSRPEPERSTNVPLFEAARAGHLTRMAVGYLTLAQAAEDSELGFLAESKNAIEWRTARTDDGYTVEARVSGAFLTAQAGERWQVVRIGVAAVDWDQGEVRNRIPWHVRGSSGAALHWQPDRFGDAAVAGSGTFTRVP